jgi:hypothetical protein
MEARQVEEEAEMTLSEVVNRVIALASTIPVYYETELRRLFPNYPLLDSVDDLETEEKLPPPPEERELQDFLTSLPDDLIYQLILIVHFWRGYARLDDMAAYYAGMKDIVGDRTQALSELMFDKGTLADELLGGLEELDKYKINVDKLPLKKAKVRKR